VAADVGELVGQDGLELGWSEAGGEAEREKDDGAEVADEGGDFDEGGFEGGDFGADVHRAREAG